MVKGHAAKFVSRMAERITHDRIPGEAVPIPAR